MFGNIEYQKVVCYFCKVHLFEALVNLCFFTSRLMERFDLYRLARVLMIEKMKG